MPSLFEQDAYAKRALIFEAQRLQREQRPNVDADGLIPPPVGNAFYSDLRRVLEGDYEYARIKLHNEFPEISSDQIQTLLEQARNTIIGNHPDLLTHYLEAQANFISTHDPKLIHAVLTETVNYFHEETQIDILALAELPDSI